MKDKLQDLIARRHPRYEAMLPHWNFVEATYEGGRSWFKDNIFRYLKEGDKEFADRVKRAYRFNHTRQVVEQVDKYLFKMPIARKIEDASDAVKAFWKRATLSGLDIDAFARRISTATSQYGRVWIVVDTNSTGGTFSRAEEKASGVQVYAYIVRPQEMLDMSYDEAGNLRWALVHELLRDDEDPLESGGGYINQYRLWTTDSWVLYEEREVRGKAKVVMVDAGLHSLGVVPIVQADHSFSEEQFAASGLIDDIAYLDRAIANYLSNLDAIIQDQTFSQLAIPAQGILPGDDGEGQIMKMGTKRIFTYDGAAGSAPSYLSPDAKQAELILKAVGQIVTEIYSSVGLAAARTKDDNGGNDTASGASKAYDFEGVNALLASKAGALEITERRLTQLVDLWSGTAPAAGEEEPHGQVSYPRDFDVRGLYDEFEIAARLSLLAAPDAMRREQMQAVMDKLFPAVSAKVRKLLESSLEDWPPKDLAPGLGAKPGSVDAGGKESAGGGPIAAASTQKTAKELAA